MGEADGTPAGASERTDAIRARLDRLVARARAAELWERTWPLLWRGFGIGLAFLAASWLGLWLDLPPLGRIVGLAAFALLLAATLLPLLQLARPSRRQALARIDRDAARTGASAHDPASAIEDTLAVGHADPATQALWALHQRRAASALARLGVAAPRPDMPRHDPFALRAGVVVAAVAAFFVAGPEWRERVGAAFDWREAQAAAPGFRVDGWIDPPLYTRLPPLIVSMSGGEQHLRAPVDSVLIVRVAGHGEATLTPNAALKPVAAEEAGPARRAAGRTPPREGGSGLREERFRLTGGSAELTIAVPGTEPRRLTVETIPDLAPEIRQVGGFEVNGRGTFTLTYRAKDDYGIASAEGVIEPLKPGRALVAPPRLSLALPGDAAGETDTRTLVDLTDNPWSGAKVRFGLVAKDEAGQEGRTAPAEVTLPARPFTQALARSLAEERRRIVTAPDEDRGRVQTALDALLIAPERFTPQPAIFLGLTTAARRLRAARSDEDLLAVADLIWEMALRIEDGDLSDAEKQLRQAQDRLKEAIERGAPEEEIAKLTQDLKQALDKFMKEFAQRQRETPKGQKKPSEQAQKGAKTVTPDDLEKMVKDMQEAMKRGDTAEAQRLLEQLRNVLENLQNAESGPKQDSKSAEMNRQMQELDEMSREQQKLRDETFKDGQEKQDGRRQKQGQQQKGQGDKPQSGQNQQDSRGQQGGSSGGAQGQGQKGQSQQGQEQSPGQRQQALRERLQDLQRRMKENGGQGEQGLSEAEDAMREAEEALGQGREGPAVDAQGRALEGLKKGAEGLQQQQEQMAEGDGEGDQPGGESPSQQGQAGAADDDPLGRPSRGRDMSNGRVRVPNADESAVQRARRIMEELRRKLGDPTRPREELDYFDRLLRRN